MPKVTFGTHDGGRIRIEVNYEDYKRWEEILVANFDGVHMFKENTTLVDGGRYWKALEFKVGSTEYRISGPVMTSREED